MTGFVGEGCATAVRLLARGDPGVLAAAWVSLKVALVATALGSLVALPAAFFVGRRRFPGRQAVVVLLNTGMGMPTVVIGLLAYALLTRRGPLGEWGLLYSVPGMILAECALVIPLIAALSVVVFEGMDPRVEATALTLGAGRFRAAATVMREAQAGLAAAVTAGFGRLIGEVGVALMVGGNIKGVTRTLTTAITLETAKGEFGVGLALGLVLIGVALGVNLGLYALQAQARRLRPRVPVSSAAAGAGP